MRKLNGGFLAYFVCVLFLALAPLARAAPSFNCQLAKSADEIAICASPRLSALDDEIAAAYDWLKAAHGRAFADQIAIPAWTLRRACGGNASCIELRQRDELQALRNAGAPSSSAAASASDRPSFDCAKARRADELAICSNPRLAELDRLLDGAYKQLLASQGQAAADAVAAPLWFRRGDCQSDVRCIASVQFAELEAFSAQGVRVELPFWAVARPTPTPTPTQIVEPHPTPSPTYAVATRPPAVAPAAPVGARRVALIVANGDYPDAKLDNPAVDARLVGQSLRDVGFDVTTVQDAKLDVFDAAMTDFAAKAKDADVALFYFAGHGFAVSDGLKQVNVLLSTSAEVGSRSERVLRAGGLTIDDVVASLAGRARATLIFIDACRSGLKEQRAVETGGRGLAPMGELPKGSLYIGVSTRIGQTAADGAAGQGSPFGRAFAQIIGQRGLRVDDAFRKVREAVKTATDNRQTPEVVDDDLPDGALTLN